MSENTPTPTLAERLRDLAVDRCCDFTGYGERSGPHDPELLDALTEAADQLETYRLAWDAEVEHMRERLRVLEVIRQRVSDGWAPYTSPGYPPERWWFRGNLTYRERMEPGVAGVLWPDEETQ